jgi:hypothetical protein
MAGRPPGKVRRLPLTTALQEASHNKLASYCQSHRLHRNEALERAIDMLNGSAPPAPSLLPEDLAAQVKVYCEANGITTELLLENLVRKHLLAEIKAPAKRQKV